MKLFYSLVLFLAFSFGLFSCGENAQEISQPSKTDSSATQPEKTDAPGSSRVSNSHAPVMMQGFYWDVPKGGTWWDVVKTKIPEWSKAGITSVWLPPASKAQNGALSMGYDPTDYFDLGEFDQNGSVETRFGSREELESLIAVAHNNNIEVYADIVINHNSGGQLEDNQYTNKPYYTKFEVKSGKFDRSQHDFHPNHIHNNDSKVFGGFPDLCHHHFYVQDWLWKADYSYAKFLKNDIGFDGWRFDFVKGFEPWVVKEWLKHNGGFSVGELWDGNAATLEWWANEANSSAFDFACYYAMKDAFDGKNLEKLKNDMLLKRNPFKAVTFVSNHDTNEIWNKHMAYAYILTHEGLPCIFYRDYEEWLDKDKLNNLIWIHDNLAGGSTTVLHTDNDEYVAKRNGYGGKSGLIVYFNTSDNWQERWIETNWSNTRIKDYTGHSDWEPVTQAGKWVKIQCPPNSYTVWSVK
ncbi:MAG: alpha-amylase [Cytophagales bacterium]|nr:alpha-amylase [Cytophagales bacterium]